MFTRGIMASLLLVRYGKMSWISYQSLKVLCHNPLAEEPAWLAGIRTRIKDLQKAVSRFKKLAAQRTEVINLTFEDSSWRSFPKKHCRKSMRLLGLHLAQSPSGTNCIYGEQEYLGNTKKKGRWFARNQDWWPTSTSHLPSTLTSWCFPIEIRKTSTRLTTMHSLLRSRSGTLCSVASYLTIVQELAFSTKRSLKI